MMAKSVEDRGRGARRARRDEGDILACMQLRSSAVCRDASIEIDRPSHSRDSKRRPVRKRQWVAYRVAAGVPPAASQSRDRAVDRAGRAPSYATRLGAPRPLTNNSPLFLMIP